MMPISESSAISIEIQNKPSAWKQVAKTSDHPFLSLEWLEPELDENNRGDLLTGFRNGEPVCVLPYVRFFLNTCLLVGGYVSSEQSFICLHTKKASAKAVAVSLSDFLNKRFIKPVVAMDCIMDQDPVASALVNTLVDKGWTKVERPGKKSPYIIISGLFDDYFMNIKRRVRKEYKRCKRNLESDYQIKRELITSPERLDMWLDEMIRIERISWKKEVGLFSAGNQKTSLTRFKSLANSDKLRVFLLIANEKLIAYDIEIMDKNILWSFNTAFDPEFRKYGPGIDLQLEVIRYAFDHNVDRVELLGDNQPYKRAFAHHTHDRSTVFLFPPGLPALFGPLFLKAVKQIRGFAKK